MSNYLAVPMMIDRHTAGLRGTHLKIAHTEYDLIAMDAASFLTTLFRADKNCGNDQELSKKIVILDENAMQTIMAGFPNLKIASWELASVFRRWECQVMCVRCRPPSPV